MARDPGSTLGIGEVARRVGLRPSAVRYYEAQGLLPAPQRQSGKRCYDESVLQRLALIGWAQRAGFTIAEIRQLLATTGSKSAPSVRWRELATRKLPEIRLMIRRAKEMERWLKEGLRCNCLSLDNCRLLENGRKLAPFGVVRGSGQKPFGPMSARSRGTSFTRR